MVCVRLSSSELSAISFTSGIITGDIDGAFMSGCIGTDGEEGVAGRGAGGADWSWSGMMESARFSVLPGTGAVALSDEIAAVSRNKPAVMIAIVRNASDRNT